MSTRPPRDARPGMLGRPVSKLRTIDDTAEILNVSTRTVRRLIDSGALSVHRFGRLIRISDEAIRELLAANCSD
jgi:excisionase family DNA binding protein